MTSHLLVITIDLSIYLKPFIYYDLTGYRPSRLAKTVKRKELGKTWEYMELFDHVLYNEIYS